MPVPQFDAVFKPKSRLWVAIVAILLAGCVSDGIRPGVAQGRLPDLFEEQVVFALVPDSTMGNRVINAADQFGYRFREETSLTSLGLVMLSFELPDGVTGAEAIDALEDAVPGSTVGVNHAYRTQQSVAVADARAYANAALDWSLGPCRALGAVGLIDTGVDATAPGLRGARVVTNRVVTGPRADTRHGTDVASILADPSRLRGVRLYNADVMASSADIGTATGADALIRALDWMAERGVRVVNMSLAGPYNKLLDLAVASASQRGLILVAAVGNSGPTVAPQYPAGFDAVIAVTAVDADQRVYRRAVRGTHVDVAAPGVDVFVPSVEGGRFVTGTSVASPFVTARIISDPTLLQAENSATIRSRLAASAIDIGPNGRDRLFGAGLIQAADACRGSAS